ATTPLEAQLRGQLRRRGFLFTGDGICVTDHHCAPLSTGAGRLDAADRPGAGAGADRLSAATTVCGTLCRAPSAQAALYSANDHWRTYPVGYPGAADLAYRAALPYGAAGLRSDLPGRLWLCWRHYYAGLDGPGSECDAATDARQALWLQQRIRWLDG